jgi:mannose-1-phosphate guanylyltransferase
MSQHDRKQRWAVILAGGDGNRLKPLTRAIAGDDRPKQFCRIIGDETLLEQTLRRVELLLNPAQTLTVVTRTHERFYKNYSNDHPNNGLLVQPENKGTAPAILLSLIRIAQLSPEAVVAFFPSDHHFTNEARFMSDVALGFDFVEAHASMITLLGIKPDRCEVEYGWIQPVIASSQRRDQRFLRVRRFWEKPAQKVAQSLMSRGSLWNTFVMVGHVEAFLKIILGTLPNLYRTFSAAAEVVGSKSDDQLLTDLYSGLTAANFSHEVLTRQSANLSVLKLSDVGWTDLGEPIRVASTFRSNHFREQTNAFNYLLT